jgi:heat shock protein HslJ
MWILLWFGLFFLQGCAGQMPETDQAMHNRCETRLYGTQWQLKMIDNDPVTLRHPPTLQFDETGDRIGGFGGCNRFFGAITLTSTEIRFPKMIGSTRKFCRGEPGQWERRYFGLLKGNQWWQFDDRGHLVIFNDEHRMIFSKIP